MAGTAPTFFPTDVYYANLTIGTDGLMANAVLTLQKLDNSVVVLPYDQTTLLNLQAPSSTVFEGTNTYIKNLFSYFPNLISLYVQFPTLDYSLYASADAQYFLVDHYIFMDPLRFSDNFKCGLIKSPSSASDIQTIINDYNAANPTALFSFTAPLPSLNGNGCEFEDGAKVLESSRPTIYTVARSYMTLYADSAYTIHYDLVSEGVLKLACPESLLSRYVAPVVTTP